MTKKEIARKRLLESNLGDSNAGAWQALWAIIDALPEEPHPISNRNPVTGQEEIFPEERRKLRIMKAMEEIANRSPEVKFKFDGACWWADSCIGWTRINDYYSPKEQEREDISEPVTAKGREKLGLGPRKCCSEEPLWEGEIAVNSAGDAVPPPQPWAPHEGWRKIRVKEVRQ